MALEWRVQHLSEPLVSSAHLASLPTTMDLLGDLRANEQGAAARPATRRRRGDTEAERIDQLQKIVQILAKLCLSSALQVRTLKACVVEVMRVGASSPFVDKAMAAVQSYVQAAKTVEKEDVQDRIGLVHHHVFNSFMSTALEVLKEAPEGLEVKKYVDEMKAMERSAMWSKLQNEVRHCRIVKAFDKKYKKVEVYVVVGSQAEAVWKYVVVAMSKADKAYKPLCGIAPRGDLERKIRAFLEDGTVLPLGTMIESRVAMGA